MITPSELLDKAIRLYPIVVDEWIRDGCKTFFPKRLPANLGLKSTGRERRKQSEVAEEIQELRNQSKPSRGFGYTVHWEEIANRIHGLNEFPKQIWIESLEDYLQWTKLKSDFQRITMRIRKLQSSLPGLEPWIAQSWSKLRDIEDDFEPLITVAQFLQSNPRPNCFPRELPLAVPTKLVERQQKMLSEWLDLLLPASSIDFGCDRKDFAARYGFKSFRKHVLIRVLDHGLAKAWNVPFDELSLPPKSIDSLPVKDVRVLIVENKTNLLTLPALHRTIGIFGEGKGISQLFAIDWLQRSEILYWGDLDVEGFSILASLKFRFPHAKSIMMDMPTIQRFEQLATEGNGSEMDVPRELNDTETEAFGYLRKKNLRIEQEHILQSHVNASLHAIWSKPSP